MQNNNYTQDNSKQYEGEFQLVLPINVEILIPEDDSVRLLSQTVEELNLRDLMLAYSSKGRNPVVPPVIMLKILLYSYMQRVYSSREIEDRCRRDINFMWLLRGYPAPDHNTIARFRTGRLKDRLEPIFVQFIEKLKDNGEISFENVFIDGTKIEANANKYSFVWKKSTDRFEARLPDKTKELLSDINEEYGTAFFLDEKDANLEVLRYVSVFLMAKKERDHIGFVSGIGCRKTPLQKFMERALEILEKKEKYQDYQKEFVNRNSFSKTDRDATFMHMKEDHMRNSQLKPGYNMQIGVENGYVVGLDISEERSDVYTLIPMLKRLEKNFPHDRFLNIVCDAGYESEENYHYLANNNYISYLKPANYEKQKTKSFKQWVGRVENMTYDKEHDEYICAKGRRLKPVLCKIDTRRRSKFERKLTIYECENCNRCGFKKCKKSEGNKRMSVSKEFVSHREESFSNITSELGILLRVNRSIQVEGAFGMLKEDYGFRRFLTRGKENVFIETMLMCFSYNINKLHNKIMGTGNKESLYKPKNLNIA
jgi:transposase